MNPYSVTSGGAEGRSASLRLAPGLKESDAIVELFLSGGRERRGETVVPQAAPVSPVGPAKADRRAAEPSRMLRFLDGPVEAEATDALDMLLEGLEAGPRHGGAGAAGQAAGIAVRIAPASAWSAATGERPVVLSACLPGMRTIEARCPYAPGVELAVDGDGALHLIAWRSAGDAGTSAISELMIASKWAWEHMSLLAKVAPLDERIRPAVQHLVTARSEGLRGLLTTSLRVHLAIAIEDKGGRRWVCAALNES